MLEIQYSLVLTSSLKFKRMARTQSPKVYRTSERQRMVFAEFMLLAKEVWSIESTTMIRHLSRLTQLMTQLSTLSQSTQFGNSV